MGNREIREIRETKTPTRSELRAEANRIYKLFLKRDDCGPEDTREWHQVRRRIVRRIEERLRDEKLVIR